MNGLCSTCPSKPICCTLCPEAELYVKQDEVAQKELTIGNPEYGESPWRDSVDKPIFTKTETRVIAALLDGKTKEEIAEYLGITRHSLKLHIQNIRKKRLKNLL